MKGSADETLYWAMVNDQIIQRSPELEIKFTAVHIVRTPDEAIRAVLGPEVMK